MGDRPRMVVPGDAASALRPYGHLVKWNERREEYMYVVVYHQFKNPEVAFARGEKLIKNEDAPAGVRGLQFYPSSEGTAAACLWEARSVQDVQEYVDSALGESSENTCWAVNADMAFAERPLGIKTPAATKA